MKEGLNMRDIIKLPIIDVDGLDVEVYASIEDVELDIESPDVNTCTVYDSEGRLLHFGVEGVEDMKTRENKKELCGLINNIIDTLVSLVPVKCVPVQKVVLKSTETQPRHKEELRKALVESLAYEGVSQEFLSKASLEELINKVIEMRGIRKLR